MIPSAALMREIDAMEGIRRDIAAISRRADEERGRELVRLHHNQGDGSRSPPA